MNLFIKAQIKQIFDKKVLSGEIVFYKLSDKNIFIKKSKRNKYTLNIEGLPIDIITRLFNKKTPQSNITNLENFYKRELRNLKIIKICDR